MAKKNKRVTPIWDLYCELTKQKHMLRPGLCSEIGKSLGFRFKEEFRYLFSPLDGDVVEHKVNLVYWGGDNRESPIFVFGPTRQNLLLLYAAYKNEL